MKSLLSVIMILAAIQLIAQESTFIPQGLGSGINSEYDEMNPILTRDGKKLYFVRSNHPENTYGKFDSQDIWVSEFSDGVWKNAIRIPELNIGRYNAVLSTTPDPNVLLINGVFNKKGTYWKKRGLSTVELKDDGTWGIPVKLKIKGLKRINDGTYGGASMNRDGSVILMGIHKIYNSSKSDIFVTTKKENGKWTTPKKVHLLSGSLTETDPFILADNKTVYFGADDEQKGQFEIYKSTRQDEDWFDWSTPKKLNDTINSAQMDSFFKANSSGSWGYFCTTKKSKGGLDIFKVKLFEENPYVIVKGTVLNTTTRKAIHKTFKIKVNGIPPDSAVFNQDSSMYKLILPLKKKYTIEAQVDNYTGIPQTIDVSNVIEYSQAFQDLLVRPYPYVLVTGKVLDRATNQPVPPAANPRIYIDGIEPDSLTFDSRTGVYTIKLNHGKIYSLQAKATRHESKPALLDLTTINEYQEIEFNLFAETEKLVRVVGRVLDKKTNQKFEPLSKAQVVFLGLGSTMAAIDTLLGTYEMFLQPGARYSIIASAPECLPTYESIDLANAQRGSTVSKDIEIAKVEVGEAVRLNNIFFESGKSTLKKESFPELDKVYDFLSQNPHIIIEIDGHTDNVGNAAFNMSLSASRAKAVADYIANKGIDHGRLQSKGYGSTKPVASNATNAGRAQNRRVEFVILGK